MWIFTAQEPQHCDRMPEASDTGSCRRRLTESLYPLSICYFNTRMNPRNEEYEVRFALLLNLHPIIFLWLSWNGLLEIFGLGPPTSRSKLLKNPFLRKRESMHSRNRRRGTAWATNFERCNKIRIVIAINSSHNIVKLYCTDLSKNRGIQSKRSRDFETVASLSLFIPTLHFVWSNFEATTSKLQRLHFSSGTLQAQVSG